MKALVLFRWIRLLFKSWRDRASWLLQNTSITWVESVLLSPTMRGSRSFRLSEDSEEFESPEQTSNLTRSHHTRIDHNEPSTSRAAVALTPVKAYSRKSTAKSPYPPRNAPERETRSSTARIRKRKQEHPRQLDIQRARFQEIRRLQNTTELLIPKLPFGRLVREIVLGTGVEVNKITRDALEALQEATEMYTTQVLTDAYLLTLHRNRVTLSVQDIEILRILRLVN